MQLGFATMRLGCNSEARIGDGEARNGDGETRIGDGEAGFATMRLGIRR